jgi:hypothetical protein
MKRRPKWITREVELLVDSYGYVRAILYPENDGHRLVGMLGMVSPTGMADKSVKSQRTARRDALKRLVEAGY